MGWNGEITLQIVFGLEKTKVFGIFNGCFGKYRRSFSMKLKILSFLLFCVGAMFCCSAMADQVSCILSGSTVREAANSAVSLPVADLDAVSLVSSVSSGGNVNARPFGAILIVR